MVFTATSIVPLHLVHVALLTVPNWPDPKNEVCLYNVKALKHITPNINQIGAWLKEKDCKTLKVRFERNGNMMVGECL